MANKSWLVDDALDALSNILLEQGDDFDPAIDELHAALRSIRRGVPAETALQIEYAGKAPWEPELAMKLYQWKLIDGETWAVVERLAAEFLRGSFNAKPKGVDQLRKILRSHRDRLKPHFDRLQGGQTAADV